MTPVPSDTVKADDRIAARSGGKISSPELAAEWVGVGMGVTMVTGVAGGGRLPANKTAGKTRDEYLW